MRESTCVCSLLTLSRDFRFRPPLLIYDGADRDAALLLKSYGTIVRPLL